MDVNEMRNRLNTTNVGDVIRITTRSYGQETSKTTRVIKVTNYRGKRRLRLRCAEGIYTGTWTLVVQDVGTQPGRGVVRVESV